MRAWRVPIVEQKECFYVADSAEEARELLRAGNEPEIENTLDVYVSDEIELYDVDDDGLPRQRTEKA